MDTSSAESATARSVATRALGLATTALDAGEKALHAKLAVTSDVVFPLPQPGEFSSTRRSFPLSTQPRSSTWRGVPDRREILNRLLYSLFGNKGLASNATAEEAAAFS